MTTKEMIAVMTAFEDGIKIEYRPKDEGYEWEDCLFPAWDWFNLEYRIKPEEPQPKYRPYANAEELDEAIKEHGMWIKCETTGTRMVISCYNDNRINYVDKDTIFNNYTWLDGTPFGVKE